MGHIEKTVFTPFHQIGVDLVEDKKKSFIFAKVKWVLGFCPFSLEENYSSGLSK